MEQTTHIELSNDNQMFRVVTRKEPLNIMSSIISDLSQGVVRCSHNIAEIEVSGRKFTISMADDGQKIASVILLNELPLKTNYSSSRDGSMMHPNPGAPGDPVLPLVWAVPASMRLILVVETKRGEYVDPQTSRRVDGKNHYIHNMHLIAIDVANRTYILPMSNIYDDGRLCNGRYKVYAKELITLLRQAITQFWDSQWNSDLWEPKPEAILKSNNVFRFAPENSGFKQMPVEGNWTEHCQPISPTTLLEKIQPLITTT